MKILIIADDEFFIKRLPDCQADVLISLGDLPDSVILAAAEKCQCREILAVRGNHDAEVPFPEGVRDLHLAVHEVAGVRFGGFCGSLRYKQGAFMFEQSEVERLMADFSPVDCFLAHSPQGRFTTGRRAGRTSGSSDFPISSNAVSQNYFYTATPTSPKNQWSAPPASLAHSAIAS